MFSKLAYIAVTTPPKLLSFLTKLGEAGDRFGECGSSFSISGRNQLTSTKFTKTIPKMSRSTPFLEEPLRQRRRRRRRRGGVCVFVRIHIYACLPTWSAHM